jgi:hypothetical protein
MATKERWSVTLVIRENMKQTIKRYHFIATMLASFSKSLSSKCSEDIEQENAYTVLAER